MRKYKIIISIMFVIAAVMGILGMITSFVLLFFILKGIM